MTFYSLKRFVAVAMLTSIATTGVWAEDAPVYDVDSYPPQFDGSDSDTGASSSATSSQPNLQPMVQSSSSGAHGSMQITPTDGASASPAPTLSMDQRLRRIEQQVSNAQQAGPKVDSLQSQVQTLRGQVEELTHQLQQLQSQQKAMYSDVDKRLSKSTSDASTSPAPQAQPAPSAVGVEKPMKAAADAAAVTTKPIQVAKAASVSSSAIPLDKPAPSATDTASQPNVAEEQQIYQTAYDYIKAKKYNDAIAALKKMLQKYPSGQFAANAHYWLGELYGLVNKNDLSAVEFSTVVNNYPDSPKVADAQLKVGLVYAGQFNWVDAKAAFKKVINRYPGTSSAKVAAEQLKQIKLAGH